MFTPLPFKGNAPANPRGTLSTPDGVVPYGSPQTSTISQRMKNSRGHRMYEMQKRKESMPGGGSPFAKMGEKF